MSYITDLQAAHVRIRDLELREQVAAEAFHKMKARAEKAEADTACLDWLIKKNATIWKAPKGYHIETHERRFDRIQSERFADPREAIDAAATTT